MPKINEEKAIVDSQNPDVVIPLRKPLSERYGTELTTGILTPEATCIKLLTLCEINVSRAGERFDCPYRPDDPSPSAYLYKSGDGRHEIRWWWNDEDGKRKGTHIHIPQLYRDYTVGALEAIRDGKSEEEIPRRRLSANEKGVWLLRLAHAAGEIELPPADAVPLRGEVPEHIRRIYDGALLLMRCRQRYNPADDGFAAVWTFLRDWTGNDLEEKEIVQAKRYLVSHGYWQVLTPGTPYQKGVRGGKATVYRHGDADEVQVRDTAARKKEASAEIDNRREAALRMEPSRPELLDDEQREAYNTFMRERAGRA